MDTWTEIPTSDVDSDSEDGVLDPRIQRELEHLNISSTEINRLENELDEARSKYRSIVSEISNKMEHIAHDRKKSIQKSREYYKLIGEAKCAQGEALKAARQFQTANGVYRAAKETVALAESRLTEDVNTAAAQLTSAWQEMLNHAITKVSEAEKEKTDSEQEHKRRSSRYAELDSRIQFLEKKFTRSIKKARPYFELKAELDLKLMQQKQNVNDLVAAIRSNKIKYNTSLKKLETISEEIHESRRSKFWSKVPRMPGVGAETVSLSSTVDEYAESVCSGSIPGDSDTVSVDEADMKHTLNKSNDRLHDSNDAHTHGCEIEKGTCNIDQTKDNESLDQTKTLKNSVSSDDEVFHSELNNPNDESHSASIKETINNIVENENGTPYSNHKNGTSDLIDETLQCCEGEMNICEVVNSTTVKRTDVENTSEAISSLNTESDKSSEQASIPNSFEPVLQVTTTCAIKTSELTTDDKQTPNDGRICVDDNDNLDQTVIDDASVKTDGESEEYSNVDMATVDRPSLSGEEE